MAASKPIGQASFRNISERYHKVWLGVALNMLPTYALMPLPGMGDLLPKNMDFDTIDLLADNLGIELKCRYPRWGQNFVIWKDQILAYTYNYEKYELYWAFMFYKISISRENVTKENIAAAIGKEREVFLLPWSFVNPERFPQLRDEKGYIRVGLESFPPQEDFIDYRMSQGVLHLPRGSRLEEKASSSRIFLNKEEESYSEVRNMFYVIEQYRNLQREEKRQA